jgi:hypothetical protein
MKLATPADPVRQQELTEIGDMLLAAGWTCHQMRAMSVLHPVWEEVAGLLEDRQVSHDHSKAPAPVSWKIHPDDAARFAAAGKHCETRGCREPVAAMTWRPFWSGQDRRHLLAEHLVCTGHAEAFCTRYHVVLEDPPAEPSLRSDPATSRKIR